MKSSKIKLFKLNQIIAATLSFSLLACGGGGSSAGIPSGGGGGGSSLNIQSVGTISSNLNSTYNPACLYEYGNSVFLINGDGSGSGLNLNLTSGQFLQVAGLPQINLANGDQCLSNYQQLTWVNKSNPFIINVFNPDNQQTVSVDLSQSGIDGSDIFKSSFSLNGSSLFANSNFVNNGTLGFSSFTVPNPTSYNQLDNSLYSNYNISQVLYGFDGDGSQFLQLLPTDTVANKPAGIAYIQTGSGGTVVQNISTITDNNNQQINPMSTAWDFTPAGNGVIITTGVIQPVLYKCTLTSTFSYQCDKTYTSTDFTSKYRIMRLLGGNANYVYFMGIDLTKNDIEVFSIQL